MASTINSDDNRIQEIPVGSVIPGGLQPEAPILQSDPTNGFRLNHLMLRIRDPEATLNFYVNLMGMRTVFAMNTGPLTVYYLGYPQTAEHRADPSKFAKDTAEHATMVHTSGLLELCHNHGIENQPDGFLTTGSTPPHIGFGHLGFTVPDVAQLVQRLKKAGVKIVKDFGEGPNDSIPTTSWEKQKGISTQDLDEKFVGVMRQIAFVEDPNGYQIELVPQQWSI